MKTKTKTIIAVFVLLIIVGIGFLIYSCKEKSSTTIKPQQSIKNDTVCLTCIFPTIYVPPSSSIIQVNDTITITAPKGYIYLGFYYDSTLIPESCLKTTVGGSITVTCNCTKGNQDNCIPVGHKGDISCYISAGCTTCDRIVQTGSGNNGESKSTKSETRILSGGFINPALGITLASENDTLPYAFEAMLYYSDILQKLDAFMLQYYSSLDSIPTPISDSGSLTAPKGYNFVVLNVFGRALVTLLPNKNLKMAGGSTYTCPCSGTSGSCTTTSTLGFYFCKKVNCNKACNTMTVSNGEETKSTIISYSYTYYFF